MQSPSSTIKLLPFAGADDGFEMDFRDGSPPRRMASTTAEKGKHRQERRVSYWECLPLEVLGDIFIYSLSLRRDRRPVYKRPPILLTQICRVWYRLVVELPQMWSTIVLTAYTSLSYFSDSDLCSGARFLEMCITRARGVPIELYLRAEFLSFSDSFEQIQDISEQVSHLTIIFPNTPGHNEDVRPTYFPPNGRLSMPNLQKFEVYNREKHISIHPTDTSQMEHIIKSSSSLRCGVFCSRVPGINGPLILRNITNIEILSIEELLPLSICFFLLQNIPTLRELSLLKVMMQFESPIYEDQVLSSMLSRTEISQPFTHSHLQCLALAYCKGDPSLFFQLATLPQLRYLVVDLRADEKISWPHSDFVTFLRRSDCRLRSLTVVDQPITPSQLLDILRLPNVGNTIDSLSIQNYRDEGRILDDSILEQLTLETANVSEQSLSVDGGGKDGTAPPSVLCPNLEDIALFFPLENLSICKLIKMLKSRSHAQIVGGSKIHLCKALRRVQMDLDPEVKLFLGDLRRGGLILRLYEQDQYDPSPIGIRQLAMLRKYLNGRGRSIVFEHDTGKWDGLLLDE